MLTVAALERMLRQLGQAPHPPHVGRQSPCPGREPPAPGGILLLGLSAQLAWYCGACGHDCCGKTPCAPTAARNSCREKGVGCWGVSTRDASRARSGGADYQ